MLSSAICAITVGSATASADCAPNPTRGDQRTICTGASGTTLTVRENGSDVAIQAGATLTSADASSIVVTTPLSGPAFAINKSTILVDGSVGGGTNSAISVTTGSGTASTTSTITVTSAGRVSGPTGINVTADPASFNARATVILDNSGTISSTTGGYALRGSDSASGRFESIINRASGTIGPIRGQVGTLTNEGLIDGGALSAFSDAPGPLQFFGQGTVVNSGTIRSGGANDTIFSTRNFNPGTYVENSGLIINTGTGRAVGGNTLMILSNAATGRIIGQQTAIGASAFVAVNNAGTITGSGDAIFSGGNLNLVNRGTINGNVRSARFNSTIDNGGGTINGSLLLGDGDDVFIGDITNLANPIGTIGGVLNAGGGNDVLRFTFRQDTTLDVPVTLPNTIERLGLRVGNSSTLTLSQNFATSSTVFLGGGDESFFNTENRFVLNGSINAQGPALLTDSSAPGGFTVANNGTIRSTLSAASDFAVRLERVTDFANTGSISAVGGNGVSLFNGVTMSNSGVITADGRAIFAQYSVLDNSGTIRSLGSVGLFLEVSGNGASLNSGRIEGAITGARLSSSTLRNSGTISGADSGVELGTGGVLENLAGGVITGGARGVAPAIPTYPDVRGLRVSNAGTINGNVDFGRMPFATGNTFVAVAGSIVNGDIHLGGGGDTFATSLTNGGPGEFAGLTGRVTGRGSNGLRYLVTADATATTARPTGIFTSLGYDLSNEAELTLTSPVALDFSVGFAGTGAVDLTADMTGNGRATLLYLHQNSVQQDAKGATFPTAIDLTSRGVISVTSDGSTSSSLPAVLLGIGDTFTNAGLIVASVGAPTPGGSQAQFAAIRTNGSTSNSESGATIENTGTIRLSGAAAARGSDSFGQDTGIVINSGIIEQQAGGRAASGIVDIHKVINSGQIRTGSAAVSSVRDMIVINSGMLASASAPAIQGTTGNSTGQIDNLRGGMISGGAGQPAILLRSGSIVQNAGTIQGDVLLDYNPFSFPVSPGSNIYINRGGTLNGNLRFSGGDDIFVSLDGATGVLGTIDAGQGTDTYVRGFSTNATVNLDTLAGGLPGGFERSGVAAYGPGAVVTLTAQSPYTQELLLTGDGSIINTATVGTTRLGPFIAGDDQLGGSTLAFINQGRINAGVGGQARSFDNQGAISAHPTFDHGVVLYTGDSEGFSFRNSGSILGYRSIINQPFGLDRLAQMSVENSGTISGNFEIETRADHFAFTNTGKVGEPTGTNQGGVELNVGRSPPDSQPVTTEDVTIDNHGTIVDGLTGKLVTERLTVINSGTIKSDIGTAVSLNQPGRRTADQNQFDPRTFDQESARLINTGMIEGATSLGSHATDIVIENSGTMGLPGLGSTVLAVTAQTSGDQTIELVNSKSIETSGPGGSAVRLFSYLVSEDGTAAGTGNASINVTNTGTIRADGGAIYSPYTPSPFPGLSDFPERLFQAVAVNIEATAASNSDVAISNGVGATISASGTTKYLPLFPFFSGDTDPTGEVPAAYSEVGSLAIQVAADRLSLDNAGAILGGPGGAVDPDTFVNVGSLFFAPTGPDARNGYMAGAIQTFGSVDTVTNQATGTITGSIDLGEFDDVLVNYGRIDGDLFLRAGNDSLFHALSGSISGIADGGDGIDRLTIDLTGAGRFDLARFVNFEDFSFTGSGALGTTTAPLPVASVSLIGADLQIAAGQTLTTAGPNTVTGTAANESVTNAGAIAGSVTLLAGDDTVRNTGSIGGSVDFGDGNDSLTGGGTIAGSVQMGAGDDTADLAALAGAAGGIDGGMGADLLRIDATTTANLTAALAGRLTNFETMQATGTGTINAAGVFAVGGFQIDGATVDVAAGATFGTAGANAVTGGANADRVVNAGTLAGNLDLGDGANQVTNAAGGTIAGGVTTGAGNDSFVNGSVVNGNVNLGNGNDTLTLQTGGVFNGAVAAGTGADQLIVQTGGTYQAPTQLNAATFTGFETLQNAGGTTQLTGAFTGGVNVAGGYLFGAPGSTINGTVGVGGSAQFGTSGVVNGNLTVAAGGTLAPGSSPGVMTVNGNVTLAAGSISTFEFVPAPGQSDQLLISGTLAIGANTTLNMTGTRPLTPGVNYDVIVANGGITGMFTTVIRPATVGGFLRYTTNRLQLMGTFLTPTGVTLQQAAAIDYVNAVLISGQAGTALLAAVPSLLRSDGAANPAAFNLLTAEAYASAAQLGVENALTLAQAGRTGIARTHRHDAGLFVFAQGMGDRRTLKADGATGVSRARSESWGVLGGIGYGADGASVGAFVGHLDSRQRISALGARTDADGVIAGLAGHFVAEGFEFNLLAAYDWSKADTGRTVPGGRVDSSRYRLGSLVLDVSVGGNIPAGTNWAVRPELGITHVRGHRGIARETGSAAFAFDIDRDRFSATFIDTSIALKGGQKAGKAFHPWLQAGIRHQISGGVQTASAGFVGATSRFAAFGAGRKETVVTAGAGFGYDIGGVTLYAAYQGEFGGGNGHSGNVGVRVGF